MKYLVCITKTPETTAKIGFTDGNTKFDESGVQYILNPYDEWYALVRALELKETVGGSVTVINVGPASNDAVIRKALAIGADEAVRVNAEPQSALYAAKQIAEYVKTNPHDVILCGKESIDYNSGEVGGMIAAFLDTPYVSFASHLDITDGHAMVKRDIEGGTESSKVSLPVVISAAKGMAEQRIPNMRGIMMAKRKPLNVIEPVAYEDKSKVVSYELPTGKTSVQLIDPENMDELVRLLQEEAKVL